jgi:hypothetical protein
MGCDQEDSVAQRLSGSPPFKESDPNYDPNYQHRLGFQARDAALAVGAEKSNRLCITPVAPRHWQACMESRAFGPAHPAH